MFQYFSRNRQNIYYGIAMAVLLLLLKWLELRFIVLAYAFEIYAAAIAVIFTILGIWLAMKLTNPRTETFVVEKEVPVREFVFNEKALTQLRISKRELEVLRLMANGMSNSEMALALFVSQNTIKTHISNIFAKLDVNRRTQAVEKAKKLSLLP